MERRGIILRCYIRSACFHIVVGFILIRSYTDLDSTVISVMNRPEKAARSFWSYAGQISLNFKRKHCLLPTSCGSHREERHNGTVNTDEVGPGKSFRVENQQAPNRKFPVIFDR